jgi:Zn finger protein HypA/HybF involved in hydrogenase expression
MDITWAWPFAFHLVFWTAVLVVAALTYHYAVSTRRRITCRACGERVQTEHDTIDHCPSCGAPLR